MGIFSRVVEREIKKQIQATAEGGQQTVLIESLLTGTRLNTAIPGVTNNYKNYESQVDEIYNKYNGDSDWGNQQTRALVDFRTAFIAGEGVSISAPNDITAEWIDNFITFNRLNGSAFISMVQATEMAGQCMYRAYWDKQAGRVSVNRVPYLKQRRYMPIIPDYSDFTNAKFNLKNDTGKYSEPFNIKDSVPVITGGDDVLSHGPTTRIGIILNDLENYDRAVKDIRRLNHVLARITPVFKTETSRETDALAAQLDQSQWKIGKMYIGTAEFDYKVPTTGAHDNLKTELVTTIKNISSVSGVPVHWLGYVDMMSNRSTADSLYEVIKNATINERTIHAEAVRELVLLAQRIYIDNGGDKITKIDEDFEVRIPLLDFNSFLERVRALSLAFNDEVISKYDYQNGIPGIDPLETNKQLEADKEENITTGFTIPEEPIIQGEENGTI